MYEDKRKGAVGMIIYELDDKQIPEEMVATWKEYYQKTEDLIIVSDYNLSYLQGVRDAAGLNCILIGSNGSEIQIGKSTPKYTEFNNVFDAVKSIRAN